jgi:hypothetical protein
MAGREAKLAAPYLAGVGAGWCLLVAARRAELPE